MTKKVEISVIIPNLHSPIVDKTIESVLAQESDVPFEIIVVGMDKFGLVDRFQEEVKFIKTQKPVPPGAARNLGAASAVGEFLLFIDSDCIASPCWIKNHYSLQQESKKPIIVGGGVDFPIQNYFTLADNVSSFHEFMMHNKLGKKKILPSLNMSLSRTVWDSIGGFNHNPAGEDTDFSLRALADGINLVFNPTYFVYHLPSRRKLRDLFQHAFFFGLYSIKANRKYWDVLYVPLLLRYNILTILFSPLLAYGVIFQMVIVEKLPLRYWHTLPLVFLIKIIWCFGFARQLRKKEEHD